MRYLCAVAVFAVLAGGVAFAETQADDVLGTWYTQNNGSKIEITKEGDTYNGKIVWLKEPNYGPNHAEAGKPKRDSNNPEAARQNDPIVGLKLLNGFKWDGSESWSGGTIYNPEDGKTYKCVMTMPDQNTLDVRGYVGVPAFGKTQTWKRATDSEEKKPETTASSGGEQSSAPAQSIGQKKKEE